MSRPDYMPDPAVEYALRETSAHFEMFDRVGRWGTCGCCPRSGGRAYPEFCEYTTRYDHRLDLAGLVDYYERAIERGRERVRLEHEQAKRDGAA